MPFDVSVVVPTWNRAKLIVECLDSILSQSCPPAAVIVVDDGSTDDTEAVVMSQFGRRVKYLRIENSGPLRARNVGVSASTTEWIAFCDSDDLWHKEKLAAQSRLCARAPELEYCFTNSKAVIDGVWAETSKFDTSPPDYWNLPRREMGDGAFLVTTPMFESLLRHQPILVPTVLMKRAFFDRIGGWNEGLGRILSEDFEFSLRCVEQTPIGVVKDPVVGVRRHLGNISGDDLKMTMGEIEVLRYARQHHPSGMRHAAAIDREIIRRSANAAAVAFELGEMDVFRQLMSAVPSDAKSIKLRAKEMISRLPKPLAGSLRTASMSLTSLRRRRT